MDSMCAYKDKLNEALTLVPLMSQMNQIEAIMHWNDAAAKFQNFVNSNDVAVSGYAIKLGSEELDSDRHDKRIKVVRNDSEFSVNNDVLLASPQSCTDDHHEERVSTPSIGDSTRKALNMHHLIGEADHTTERSTDEDDKIGQVCPLTPISGCRSNDMLSTSALIASDNNSSLVSSQIDSLTEGECHTIDQNNQLYSDSGGYLEGDMFCSNVGPDDLYPYPAYTKGSGEALDESLNDEQPLDDASLAPVGGTRAADNQNDCINGPNDDSYDHAAYPTLSASVLYNACIIGQANAYSLGVTQDQTGRITDYSLSNDTLNNSQFQCGFGLEQQVSHPPIYSSSNEINLGMMNNENREITAITRDDFKSDFGLENNDCNICGKSGFSTKGNLKRHLSAHLSAGNKPFQCQLCEAKFTEKKSLKIHERKHTGERPFKCSYCDKEFTQANCLKLHLSIHTGRRQFECERCKKAFRQRSQLKLHMLRHDGIKKLKCSKCESKFLTKGDLERHYRTHTGERPFACNTCGKTFTRQQSLNEHMNRHIGKKPHICKQCGDSFSDTGALCKVHRDEQTSNELAQTRQDAN